MTTTRGLEAAFMSVDTSDDGKISSEEMRACITRVYGKGLDEKTFTAIMEVVDVDGDGEIDLDEFKAIMRAGPHRHTHAADEGGDDDDDEEEEEGDEEAADQPKG